MTRLKGFLYWAALVSLLPTATSRAESLEDEEKWNNQKSYMDRYMNDAREVCGIAEGKWSYTFDKESFSKGPGAEWSTYSPNGRCGAVFDELGSICRSGESGKKRVQEKVKSLVCKFGGKGKEKLELKGGVITLTLDWDSSGEFIGKQLKKQL